MTQQPKKQPDRIAQAHVYMTPAMKKRLEKFAKIGCRSVNGQMLHYIQRGIEQDEAAADD